MDSEVSSGFEDENVTESELEEYIQDDEEKARMLKKKTRHKGKR